MGHPLSKQSDFNFIEQSAINYDGMQKTKIIKYFKYGYLSPISQNK